MFFIIGVLKSPSKQEQVAAKVIRRKSSEAAATGATTMSFATGGRPLTLAVPQRKKLMKALYPDGNIPTEEVQRMMNAAHISLKQTSIIAKFHRVWMGRDSYEAYVAKKLSNSDKVLEPFFSTMIVPMDPKSAKEKKESGKTDRCLVYCHNLGALVAFIIQERGWEDATKIFIKTGTDTGEGSLKISMTIEKIDDEDDETPLNSPVKKSFAYGAGALPQQFKPSGQHGCIIIAHVESADESYDNIKTLTEALDCYKGFMEPNWIHIEVDDLKAANTSFGIGASGSTCPDVFCDLPKNSFGDPDYLFEGGDLRTMESIRDNASNYEEKCKTWNKSTKYSSNTFKSCENQPLRKHEGGSILVLLILAIMSLHLKLGNYAII